MYGRLGEMLVKSKLIKQEQLEEALKYQKTNRCRLGTSLVKLNFIKDEVLAEFLSKQYGVRSIDLEGVSVEPSIISLIPAEIAQKYMIIPLSKDGNKVTIAMADPSNIYAIDDLKFMTGFHVEPVVATEGSIRLAIDKFYDSAETLRDVMDTIEEEDMELVAGEEDIDDPTLKEAIEDAPVVKLVNLILRDAIKQGASDIHAESYEKDFRIRFRIDGVLHDVMSPPLRLKAAIISRLKIMSELDISERRLPQDGRMKVKLKNKEINIRVSTTPTLFGEKVVLRLLDPSSLLLDMTHLGFEKSELQGFEKAISSPFGMILVTGPTGSGKTTTLYCALDKINNDEKNIMTAEDPVEFNLRGINQVQMKESIGLNFASALRSFLRQDPDIIMVGEIRDFETAETAVKAALTGHLVFSTLHTNDAPSTISRLLNMGIEPFLVSSSVIMILAQRLVRRICENCKEKIEVPTNALIDIGFSPEEAKSLKCYKGKGCEQCGGTGYKGRVALYEVMPVREEIKELILKGASDIDIKREAVKLGMRTLRKSGLEKIKEELTTIEEVLRVTF